MPMPQDKASLHKKDSRLLSQSFSASQPGINMERKNSVSFKTTMLLFF
ncbi:MAG: hypothetical protein HYV53_04470 [Parcubacteria group bacterium]|nr:hypothetical protein [Parcubacteria group bacterium]